jgi:hypothetical protein
MHLPARSPTKILYAFLISPKVGFWKLHSENSVQFDMGEGGERDRDRERDGTDKDETDFLLE